MCHVRLTQRKERKDVAVEKDIYIFSASVVLHVKINKGLISIAHSLKRRILKEVKFV